jgi:hypothetical protein
VKHGTTQEAVKLMLDQMRKKEEMGRVDSSGS